MPSNEMRVSSEPRLELICRTWIQDLSNTSLTDLEISKMAVWEYPMSDQYTKIFTQMKMNGFPKSLNESLERLRGTAPGNDDPYALIGDTSDARWLALTNCDLHRVSDELSRKPYAIAVQKGSPLKDEFNKVYVSAVFIPIVPIKFIRITCLLKSIYRNIFIVFFDRHLFNCYFYDLFIVLIVTLYPNIPKIHQL